jgi:hypothetical protein
MTDLDLPAQIVDSQERWRAGRRYLNDHRHELAQRASRELYAADATIGQTGLLTRSAWLPAAPIPLADVGLVWCEDTPAPEIDGREPESAGVRPLGRDGGRYVTYAEALGDLARPRLYEDRPCYRLLDVAVDGAKAQLSFGLGAYFDLVNVSEAIAHELAAASSSALSLPELPLRSLVVDPCDLRRRAMLPAISALTIRRASTGAAFALHKRDATKVVHAGGMYQVMPVGIFQPSAAGAWNEANDFDLWRCMAREFSEEFLGAPEHQGHDGPLDYDGWDFYRTLTDGRDSGQITAGLLGLGVDPLSLVTDLLVAVVIESELFDELFGDSVSTNAEGFVAGRSDTGAGMARLPFTEDQVIRLTAVEPMQAAGAAVLSLAWEQRATLLG